MLSLKVIFRIMLCLFVLMASIEAGRIVSKIPIFYFKQHQKKEYMGMAKKIQATANNVANCLNVKYPEILIIDSAMSKWYTRLFLHYEQRGIATTRIRGLIDLMFDPTQTIIVHKDIMEKYAGEKELGETIAHELVHHILEPSIYHTLVISTFWPSLNQEKKEDLIDDFAINAIKLCKKTKA